MAPMTKGSSIPRMARFARWRIWVQATFLVAWLDPLMLRVHAVCSPVFHCHSCPLALFACPIGILANFSALHMLPFVAIGTLVVIGGLFGSFICGWVCPFGFIQDLIGRIPTRKFELPTWMGFSRYVVLVVLVLAVPYGMPDWLPEKLPSFEEKLRWLGEESGWLGEDSPLFFCRLCPAGALEAALPNTASTAINGQEIAWPSATKTTILVLFTVAMLFTWRPWCTLFCPLGAIYGLLNRLSFFFVRFHPTECNDCDRCRTLCRYHGQGERRGDDMRCIRCMDCTRCTAVTLSHVFQPRSESSAEHPASDPE